MVRMKRQFPRTRPGDRDRSQHLSEEWPPFSALGEDRTKDYAVDQIEDHIEHPLRRPGARPAMTAPSGRLTIANVQSRDAGAAAETARPTAPKPSRRSDDRRSGFYEPRGDQQPPPAERPRASRSTASRLFWSFCINLVGFGSLIAAFGLIQPLNDMLPKSVAQVLAEITDELGMGVIGRPDTIARVHAPDEPMRSGMEPPKPVQPVASVAAAAVAASPVSPAAAEPAIPLPDRAPDEALEAGTEFVRPESVRAAVVEVTGSTPPAGEANGESVQDLVLQPLPATPQAAPDKPADPIVQPVIQPLSAPQIDLFLTRGLGLLEVGDIASARLLFLRVAGAGDQRGARGVGMTYDPEVYARLPVAGIRADPELADYWYRKAGDVPAMPIAGGTATVRAATGDAASGPTATESIVAGPSISEEPVSAERHAACARKYKSYDPDTGLYNAFSGTKRPCRLP